MIMRCPRGVEDESVGMASLKGENTVGFARASSLSKVSLQLYRLAVMFRGEWLRGSDGGCTRRPVVEFTR